MIKKVRPLPVRKIISGGQTGADLGGLKAGILLGLETGGWVPRGCRTILGSNFDLVTEYGCQEHTSLQYPPRTFANVRDSDGTVRFAANFYSPGELCTMKAIRQYGKPYFDVDIIDPPRLVLFRKWLIKNRIETLNVAGNSEQTSKGIEQFVISYLRRALKK